MQSNTKARKVARIPNPQPAEGWTFVNLSEPRQSKDKSLRQFVRSHAMRDYRQRKKQIKTKNQRQPESTTARHEISLSSLLPKSTIPISAQNDDDGGCFISCGHAECVHDRRSSSSKVRSSPKQLFGDSAIDLFGASLIGGDSRYTGLVLNHCELPRHSSLEVNTVLARHWQPLEAGRSQHPFTNEWMPHAVTDPLLFLATLNYAAAHLDVVHGRQSSPRTIAQKGQIIRLINMRLQDSAETVSNTTIGAVAMFAAMETTTGNQHDLSVHMDGLDKMVTIRGGLQQLGWDGVLQLFISWQDLVSSALMSTPPRFPRRPNRLIIQGEIPSPNPICPELGASTELCATIIKIFNDMRHVTDLLNSFDDSVTLVEPMSYNDVRSGIKHCLLSLEIRKPKQQMQDLDYRLEACRVGALIFLNRPFDGNWPHCLLIRHLRCQLKELLLEKESRIFHQVHPQVHTGYYIWGLFIGGIHSRRDEDIEFFAKRIATSTQVWQVQGLGGWPEILSRIKTVAWIDALQNAECEVLGKQVERFIRSDDGGRDLIPEESAPICWPVELDPNAALISA
ncbi:MAG: hypothetical protein ASARMPRED_008317 [Alectoria sarmentosa]|nr:MAG: hypothetical protein ASARMPRED_008317 [Alectoria sarmentosa]